MRLKSSNSMLLRWNWWKEPEARERGERHGTRATMTGSSVILLLVSRRWLVLPLPFDSHTWYVCLFFFFFSFFLFGCCWYWYLNLQRALYLFFFLDFHEWISIGISWFGLVFWGWVSMSSSLVNVYCIIILSMLLLIVWINVWERYLRNLRKQSKGFFFFFSFSSSDDFVFN